MATCCKNRRRPFSSTASETLCGKTENQIRLGRDRALRDPLTRSLAAGIPWGTYSIERHPHTGRPIMVSVFIPPAWRDLSGDVVEVSIEAGTIRQLVNALEERFPGMRERAVEDDALRPGLAVAINGSVSRLGLRQRVPAGAEVHFLPALGGG